MSDKPKSIIDLDIKDTSDDVSFEIKGVSKEANLTNALNPFENIHAVKQDHIADTATAVKQIKNLENITNCPRCNKPLVKAESINGDQSESFLECPECGTLINTYRPTYYQAEFLRRPERYKMGAGGFGTGKSRMNIEDVIKHLLLIPGARVLIVARSYPALDSTFIKEFYARFPKRLLRYKNDSKHELQITNGSEILFRSLDDPLKLKSINASMVLMVEASDCPYSGFEMVQSRLRNTVAMIPELDINGQIVKYYDDKTKEWKIKYAYDARHISLETNPDSGWVKKDFLLDAGTVEFYGEAHNEGYRFKKVLDKHKYIQVVSTSANPYLPPTYEEEQTRGKSKAYIMQFYKGSFNFSSNLVFPNFGTIIKEPHPLPRAYNEYGKRVLFYAIGVDYGINDPTHAIFAAFSTETRKLYVFAEYRKNDTDVKILSKGYRRTAKQNSVDFGGLLMQPRFDGRSYNKRQADLKTIGEMFEAEGLYFEPSFYSHEIRIIKTNALINHDQIEVYSTCEFLIDEALNYKFKLDKNGEPTKNPQDKKDHGVTALEFITVELPHNLHELNLSAYLPNGTEIVHDKRAIAQQVKKKLDPRLDPLKEVNNGRVNNGSVSGINGIGDSIATSSFSIHDTVYEEDRDDEDPYADSRPATLGAYIPGR